jgi:hypothetical protein
VVLISETHGDSNRCTPNMGKPNQHVTRFPHSVYVWPSIICISRGPYIATFRTDPIDLDRSHYSRERGLLTTSPARRLTNPRVPTQFLSPYNHWSSMLKPSFYWRQAIRLTEPITPACDQYVQYLLTGANPSVLNWHRRGLQPWRCHIFTSHSPPFSTDGPPLST